MSRFFNKQGDVKLNQQFHVRLSVLVNPTKGAIFVISFLILLLGSYLVAVNSKEVTKVSATPKETTSTRLEDKITNTQIQVNINDLNDVTNKTTNELEKMNEKELEEANKKGNTINTTTSTKKQNKYYIKVNYGAQVVNVYTYDKNGKYTVPVKAFVCSTGTETPRSGVYKIPSKILWCYMYGDVWGHYCSQIVGNILFHSVPYLERNNYTLEYWAYDKLGTKASMGCIRLTTRDAKWIFDNVAVGTSVEFYSSPNPGPLGKPSAKKISNAPGNLKWWDPTDPDPKNPWKNYKPNNNSNTNTNNNTNNTTGNNTTNNTTTNNITNNTVQNEQTNDTTNENLPSENNEVVDDNNTQNNETVNDIQKPNENTNTQSKEG